jgi:hypothetical protein
MSTIWNILLSTTQTSLPNIFMLIVSSLANTLCYKWGYGNDIETFQKEASDRFSLLKDGTLKKEKCARLFLVNVSLAGGKVGTGADMNSRGLKMRSSRLMTTISRSNMDRQKRLGKTILSCQK